MSLKTQITMAGILFVLSAACYVPTLWNGFVYDDPLLIGRNVLIRQAETIPQLLVTDQWAGHLGDNVYRRYRPLPMVSYALNFVAAGTEPFGYHLVNVLLHATACTLFYLVALAWGWSPRGAFIAAALFAIHPLHSEAVAWVSSRSELMMAVGMFGALWCVSRGWLIPGLLSFLFALLSKEQAVVLPGWLVLADICNERNQQNESRVWSKPLARYGPYLLLLGLFLAWRTAVLGGFQPSQYPFHENPLEHATGLVWFLSTVKMAGYYLWLSLWPASLSVDYSFNALPLASSWIDAGVLWSLTAWGMLAGLALWGWGGDRRVTLAVGLTALAFVPVANVLVPVGTPIAERVFYLPLSGLCLLVGVLADRLMTFQKRRWSLPAFIAIGLIIGGALATRTVARVLDWKSNETLYRSTVAAVPASAKAHFLLGAELIQKNEPGTRQEGVRELETAVDIYPPYGDSPNFANKLGVGLFNLGRYEESLHALQRAATGSPTWADPHFHLGLAYTKMGQFEDAIKAWQKARYIEPDHMMIRLRLSQLLVQQGRYEDGLQEADAAYAHDPNNGLVHYYRGRALQGLGRWTEAEEAYRYVLAIPDAVEIVKTQAAHRLQQLQDHHQDKLKIKNEK